MTVASDGIGEIAVNWTGVETSFSAGFPAQDEADIFVIYQAVGSAVQTALTPGVHFSVALAAGTGMVTVTPLALPAAPATLYLVRTTPATQETDFGNLGKFTPAIHTYLHDRAALRDQEIRRIFARAVVAPHGQPGQALPLPVANEVLGWNSAGTALENVEIDAGASLIKANAADAAAGTDDLRYMTALMTVLTINAKNNNSFGVTPDQSPFNAVRSGTSNDTVAIAAAAAYAATNHFGLRFLSGANAPYRCTPLQFGDAYRTSGTFSGTIAGNTLTVNDTPTIPLARGQTITGPGVTACKITAALAKSAGFIGSYTIDGAPQAVGPVAMTATAPQITASISGDTMTATVNSGKLYPVDAIAGGTVINGTTILAQLTGPAGGSGTYQVSQAQSVASSALQAYPYTVVPLPNFLLGPPGGETVCVIRAFGAVASPEAVIKVVNPPALGVVLGFEIGNLRIDAFSVFGNALKIHGFSATSGGGVPIAHDLTLNGATGETGGLCVIGNAPGGGASWGVIEAVFARISSNTNAICDATFNGKSDGAGSFNIQSVTLADCKFNSNSSGDGCWFDYSNLLAYSLVSQSHGGNALTVDHTEHFECPHFYSEANGGPFTGTANSHGISITGTAAEGIGALLRASPSCKIHVRTLGSSRIDWEGALFGLSSQLTQNAIGAVSTDGQILENTTAAAAGSQQWPPRQRFSGKGWATNSGGSSQGVDWIAENQIAQGTANPLGKMTWSYQVNGGGYSAAGSLHPAGIWNGQTGYQIAQAAPTNHIMVGNGSYYADATSLPAAAMPALTGDITSSAGAVATTLATVNANVGTFGSATQVAQVTLNGKGLATAAANVTVTPAVGSITGLGTGVATALAVNVGSAGAAVVNGGALGSPSSVGTLPAHTLGGTVSGGGSQINNVVIGAVTPLAGTFTTMTANGAATVGGDGSTFTVGPGGTGALNGRIVINGSSGAGNGSYFQFNSNSNAGSDAWFFGLQRAIEASGSSKDFEVFNQVTSGRTMRFSSADDSVSFGSTVSGSSTTVASVLGKSLGLSENANIGGLLAVTGKLFTKQGSVAVVNGLNSNIATPANSWIRLTGPSAVFSIGGFTGGADGYKLIVYCTVAFAMTIVNEDASSTAGNRIKTLTGANVTLRAGTSICELTYDATDARWILTNTN